VAKNNKMKLNKNILNSLPVPSLLERGWGEAALPETVLQFGTGVLLRGLPDYYIDKANKQGIFNGRIVVVKSTGNGDADEFTNQDCLYTHCIKGIKNNEIVDETIINSSISRVLSAKTNWQEILATAANPEMQLILSNTTEVGIVYDETDDITNNPPNSFPGKLLAWLHKRYETFNGSKECGVAIIPTELITDNGTKLKMIVEQLAAKLNMDKAFTDWLFAANDFCNSLVDRIVPGKMPEAQHKATEEKLGYKDELMIMSEVYSLWAIETTSQRTKDNLSFSAIDNGIIIAPNINKYREIKLRLLNGTHTFSCGLAFLAGFDVVKDAMANKSMNLFVYDLMKHEIGPCIENVEITRLESYEFAKNVLDRFRNPYIDHRWLSITLNYTGKMKMRNLPLITEHYNRFNNVPQYMAIGFAAYILFMKAVKETEGKYYGNRNNENYLIQDEWANYYFEIWKNNSADEVVKMSLNNENIWGCDVNKFDGFANAVTKYLKLFIDNKFFDVIENIKREEVKI
jgi:tagaturonate reductase